MFSYCAISFFTNKLQNIAYLTIQTNYKEKHLIFSFIHTMAVVLTKCTLLWYNEFKKET